MEFIGFILVMVATLNIAGASKIIRLSSGYDMPKVALGTATIPAEKMELSIFTALESGYRHIDTAFDYFNEAGIGRALKKWFGIGGKREELFITSKLPDRANRPESVERYLKKSLTDLNLTYIDMYLIHKPWTIKDTEDFDWHGRANNTPTFETPDILAVWKVMEKQVKDGRVKSIGLSNFNASQVLRIYNAAEIKPSNLQVECHAYFQQNELYQFCRDHKIALTAYSPLGSRIFRHYFHNGTAKDLMPLVELEVVKEIAQRYNKSPAQILLRHLVQVGRAVTPKSADTQRQRENLDIFDFRLDIKDVLRLNSLDKGEHGRIFNFVALVPGVEKHPEFPFMESLEMEKKLSCKKENVIERTNSENCG
ncbi:alcohol dehydrogenase [NADP(+)]-like [Trichogramma pretiosum]|uniref:alcohol dehydrogenase [NADP(+)]-like n=1 Tax=Trichogramma pretiosum TaxID=7493 RepID=UPI000C71B51F|nr:alcohol dehydrogenase [NADP(+)]-like [Trichogramma pretiosum]